MARFSVNVLLKSVIAALAATIMVLLALGSWQSWNRLQAVNRITAAAAASSHIFKALHNLRSDRTQTVLALGADAPGSLNDALLKNRAIIMDGMKETRLQLQGADLE